MCRRTTHDPNDVIIDYHHVIGVQVHGASKFSVLSHTNAVEGQATRCPFWKCRVAKRDTKEHLEDQNHIILDERNNALEIQGHYPRTPGSNPFKVILGSTMITI